MSDRHQRISRQQLRALRAIDRMGDDASDSEGDLSVCSGNWPATHSALVRRGLVEATYNPDSGAWDGYGYWTYVLTDAGKEAIRVAL